MTIHNEYQSLPSLQLAKLLLPATIYTNNHYRYHCKTLQICFCLMVRHMTTQTNLCTCLYINVWTSIYMIIIACISISGQLSETFRLLIKSQPLVITQTSGLDYSIAHCLVSLEPEFQFCDAIRCKMTAKILEHVISELLDCKTNYQTALLSCAFLRINYWINHQVLLITLLWVIGSFKKFCRKFLYVLTAIGKSFVQKQ